MACGADTLGTSLIASLTNDVPFDIPNTTIPATITKVTVADLTSGAVNGTGSFDKLMAGISVHLKNEFDKNRITGAEYTKAFIASTELALNQGAAFALACDKQYWENLLTQQQAIVSRLQAENLLAEYAAKKLQLAKLSSEFCISEYTLNNMLPAQLAMLNSQKLGQDENNRIAQYNLNSMLPAQKALVDSQKLGQDKNNSIADYNLASMLPQQLTLLTKQTNLTTEQYEAARAQTLNTRSDGTAVDGNLGGQRALHAQQVVSYKSDAKLKVGKIFSDTWITQKTLNDEIDPPVSFTNPTVESVMAALRLDVSV